MIAYRSIALEYVDRRPTPKEALENETPILMLEESDVAYHKGGEDDPIHE